MYNPNIVYGTTGGLNQRQTINLGKNVVGQKLHTKKKKKKVFLEMYFFVFMLVSFGLKKNSHLC